MSDVAPIRPEPEDEIRKALAGAGQSKPEVKPVAKGRVSKSIGATVARSIFADSISGVGNYVLHELILPNVREMIQSVVVGGIERPEFEVMCAIDPQDGEIEIGRAHV